MTSFRVRSRILLFIAAAAVVLFDGGCLRFLLPARVGTARSFDISLDSRRAPAPALSSCFIPATFPALTKLPIVFLSRIPRGAKFTGVKADVILKNEQGDPMAVVQPVIEDNHVYLKFAVPKKDAFTQWTVVVTVKYEYHP